MYRMFMNVFFQTKDSDTHAYVHSRSSHSGARNQLKQPTFDSISLFNSDHTITMLIFILNYHESSAIRMCMY